MKKALILCLICSLLFSGITVTSAYANTSVENQLEPFSKDMAIPLSDAEMAKIRNKIKQLEKLDGQQLGRMGILRATESVAIGTNRTITAADSGTVYRSDYPNTTGSWGTSSNGWLDCRTEYSWPGNGGEGYSWGWIGKYVSVTGSGSRNCTISLNGTYNGILQTAESLIGNNCYCLVAAQICDVTNGGFSVIGEKIIVEKGYSFLMLPNTVSGTIGSSNSIQCTLQAGHTYLLRLKLYTSAEAGLITGPFSWGLSDFDNGGADGQGVDYQSVSLTWN